jgi:hypothetical protein
MNFSRVDFENQPPMLAFAAKVGNNSL